MTIKKNSQKIDFSFDSKQKNFFDIYKQKIEIQCQLIKSSKS